MKAVVPAHLKTAGIHFGRVSAKESGSFTIGGVQGISSKYCQKLQRADGYGYSFQVGAKQCA